MTTASRLAFPPATVTSSPSESCRTFDFLRCFMTDRTARAVPSHIGSGPALQVMTKRPRRSIQPVSLQVLASVGGGDVLTDLANAANSVAAAITSATAP